MLRFAMLVLSGWLFVELVFAFAGMSVLMICSAAIAVVMPLGYYASATKAAAPIGLT